MKQSPNDLKKYQSLTLNNGLRVLLVENIESNKAAAALAVNVGHFSDPDHRQGMAHFLEHMLFLGTKTYPDGSEYQKFINQYGGSNNAWTATEHTCFFFDINHQFFEPALDRFSRFFYEPLLSQELLNSERQNIDAEFKLKLKDGVRRLYDVHKETINPEHPFSKFSVGNKDTLADSDDHQIRDEIVSFFNQYYRANYMTLVLESPFPLKQMHQLAVRHFENIPQATQASAEISQPLYLAEHLQKRINVKPIKNDKKLIISFAMPSIDKFYRNKPESLLAYLLGHEGKGSILSLLKNKQWALGLSAGSGINGSNFKDFNISLTLTELGEKHIDEIITICFSYINLLKKNQPIAEHYYQDKQAMADLSFKYLEKQKPIDSVSQLVINMQHYPEPDYIFGDYAMDKLCHQSIEELLNYITPMNMRVIHISQDNQFDKVSKWYHVPYSVTNLSSEIIKAWHKTSKDTALHLPEKNPYIVANPAIVDSDESTRISNTSKTQKNKQETNVPALFEQSDGINIWFKQDTVFNVPKGYIYISIDSPFAVKSTENIAMLRLFVDMYSDTVLEKNYNAELAGIHYHLYSHQGGLTLQLSGLSEKQPVLLDNLLAQLVNTQLSVLQNSDNHTEFTEQKFSLFKQQLINHWENTDNSKSISQLFSCLSSALQPKNPSSQALSQALKKVNFSQFLMFSQQIFQQVSLDVLIHGNWLNSHAQTISKQIKKHFNQHYSESYFVNVPSIDIANQGDIAVPLHIPDHDHACVVYFPMPDKTLKTSALTMITSQLLSPDFFKEMRTDKQFGYLVGVGFVPINRYPGLAFYIQSPHTLATTLMVEINQFIESCVQKVEEMTNDDWQQIQHGLAAQLTESDTSLRIKSQRFWSSITNKDTDFSQKKELIDILLTLTLEDIIYFVEQQLIASKNLSKVSLLSYKNPEQFDEAQQEGKQVLSASQLAEIKRYKY